MARKLKDQLDASLRDRLMDVAEALYAERGFSEVSFRQVCVAAGARNNFAVQYHFGSLERFASAIVARRSPQFEVQRGERLARAMRSGPLTIQEVLEILDRPIVELRDAEGGPLGAKFMVSLQNTPWGWKPLSDQLDTSPVTQQLIRYLEDLLPHIPPQVIWQRLYLTSLMIMSCAAQIPEGVNEGTRNAVLNNVFSMAAAALQSPIDASTASAMLEMHK